MFRRDGRAVVVHLQPAHARLIALAQADDRANVSVAHRVGQQVAEGALQQLLVGKQLPTERVSQVNPTIVGQGFKVVTQLIADVSQIQRAQVERTLRLFGTGEEHQVFRHTFEPFELFHVRGQHFLIFRRTARVIQRLAIAGEQGMQRRADFVSEVGGELRQALEAVLQPREHGVQRVYRLEQFRRRANGRQTLIKAAQVNAAHRFAQLP